MMKRRGFLKGLFGAALVPIVGKDRDGISLMSIPHPHLNEQNIENACADMSSGFGLSPVRAEGAAVPFDLLPSKRWVSHQALENGMWDRVNKVYLAERDDMVLLEFPACDCDDGPHGTACSNRNVLRRM